MSRVAVVTGGDSGIGAACAEALADNGCDAAAVYAATSSLIVKSSDWSA